MGINISDRPVSGQLIKIQSAHELEVTCEVGGIGAQSAALPICQQSPEAGVWFLFAD